MSRKKCGKLNLKPNRMFRELPREKMALVKLRATCILMKMGQSGSTKCPQKIF